MKYKLLACILGIILIFPSVPSLAANYDYIFKETYCGSTGKESRKINIKEYFEDMPFYDDIYQIFVESITVGGNDGRGVVLNYNWPWSKSRSGLFMVPSNPGDGPINPKNPPKDKDDVLKEYKIIGLGAKQAFSIKAEEGELYFMKMEGRIAVPRIHEDDKSYKNFIIIFKHP
jgi:hypothetical protein